MFKAVINEEFDVNKVAIVNDKLSQVIMCLFDKVDSLEKETKELKQEWMKLKMLEEDVLLGQIALITEKEIVKCILRDTDVQQTKHITINQLESVLDPARKCWQQSKQIFSFQEQIEKAIANWDRLDKGLKLDYKLYGATQTRKMQRDIKAHPNLSLENVDLSRLSNSEDKEIASKLIKVLKYLSVPDIGTLYN